MQTSQPRTVDARHQAWAHLQHGDRVLEHAPGRAANHYQRAAALAPHDPVARGKLGIALQRLRSPVARSVFDYRLVCSRRLSTAPGFGSLSALNRALLDELAGRPDLFWNRPGVATIGGLQTRNLLEGQVSLAVASIASLVWNALASYVSALSRRAGGFFDVAPVMLPGLRRVDAVIVAAGGHQREHMHDYGYCSAVYYVAAPGHPGAGGQLIFHKQSQPGGWSVEPLVIHPVTGLLVVFPSYLFHCTTRYSGTQPRVSLAFDLERPRWSHS